MPRSTRIALYALAAFAALAFLRFYVSATHLWINLDSYLAGTERLPFQLRVLPIPFLVAVNRLAAHMPFLEHGEAVLRPDKFSLFCLSSVAFAAATYYTFRLYRAVSPTRQFEALLFPAFLVLCLWTYTVHIGDVLSYPYDLPAVAFFTAGLYYIYVRRFWPLVVVVLVGTFNRETTLFLIPIYLIDAASIPTATAASTLRSRISLRGLPWLRAALLFALWFAIDAALKYRFRFNDRSEDFSRVAINLHKLTPRQWPSILNICGFTLPALILLRRYIAPARFANTLLVFPLWFAVMFFKGNLSETRIYGELTAWCAIAIILLIEDHARTGIATLEADSSQL